MKLPFDKQLAAKLDQISCAVEIVEMDLSVSDLNQKFDGIISSMTLHHIKDTVAMFSKFTRCSMAMGLSR